MKSPMHRRLGFSFLYFAPRLDVRHERWFGALAQHGYHGAEVPVNEANDADLAWLRRTLHTHGLGATAVGFAVAGANPLAADAQERRAAVDHLGRLAEKTASIGANLLAGPLHSAFGVFTEQPPTADERARCIEVLHAAGERAGRVGVRLAIEPLNRFESYFLNTAGDCDSLVRAVNHPSVVSALDTHHAHIEENDLIAAIHASVRSLSHVQLSENHRGTPGTGQVPFDRVLQALDEIGYDGWLVIEAFSRHEPDFANALRIWRPLDEGPDAVMAAGARIVGVKPRHRATH